MIPYQNPTIYIGSLRVDEPITTLTDLVFFGMCCYAFIKTKHVSRYKAMNLYRWFFLVSGIGIAFGAIIGHAFLYQFPFEAKLFGWCGGILGCGIAQFAALYHTQPILKSTTFKSLFIVNVVEITGALIAVFTLVSFVVAEIHSAFGFLLIVTTLEYKNYKATQSYTSKYLMLGIAIAVLAILCHLLKLAISNWFNHMDLSHVIMTISMYMMYKGVKKYTPQTT